MSSKLDNPKKNKLARRVRRNVPTCNKSYRKADGTFAVIHGWPYHKNEKGLRLHNRSKYNPVIEDKKHSVQK